jgi:hypothetical protein
MTMQTTSGDLRQTSARIPKRPCGFHTRISECMAERPRNQRTSAVKLHKLGLATNTVYHTNASVKCISSSAHYLLFNVV